MYQGNQPIISDMSYKFFPIVLLVSQLCLYHYFSKSIYLLFIFGCIGSSPRTGFLQLWQARATLHCDMWASYSSGFSCCGAWALGCMGFSSCGTWSQQFWLMGSREQAQQLWHMGLVALQHVGSSWTRAPTHVLCIGRWILNHCATREVLYHFIP